MEKRFKMLFRTELTRNYQHTSTHSMFKKLPYDNQLEKPTRSFLTPINLIPACYRFSSFHTIETGHKFDFDSV